MKNFEEWKVEYLKKKPNSNLTDWELRTEFANYLPLPMKVENHDSRMTSDNETEQKFSSPSIEKKIDELNENLKFFKRYIVLITIAFFVIMSWTSLRATGSWCKWFDFSSDNERMIF